jgi:16S rRNA processing protein RimM
MGRVVAAYGVSGWVKARGFTAAPNALLGYGTWWLARGGDVWREFRVLAARAHGGGMVAQLEGLASREDAAAWGGASVGVPRQMLPALASGEVYLADILGLEVVNREGEGLGRVAGVLETPAHPVLRVESAGRRQRLIPLVAAHIDAIDLAGGRVMVDWRKDY